MLIFGGTLPHKLPPRQNRRPVEKVLFPSRKNPLNFGRLSFPTTRIPQKLIEEIRVGVSLNLDQVKDSEVPHFHKARKSAFVPCVS